MFRRKRVVKGPNGEGKTLLQLRIFSGALVGKLTAGRMRRLQKIMGCFVACWSLSCMAWAQQSDPQPARGNDLVSMNIEDLMNVRVTSVSKTEETLSRTAAAVFIITQADIARSGAVNIPDALRMVPGMDVAQIDANTWAISARGLNDEFSNELLVLIDGRNVYTPTFGGVLWGQLDLPLENIERIEVIRGPGGSIWGANAVNGIINIITKSAAETQGVTIVAGGGNQNQEFGTTQYGGGLGKDTSFRVYAKYFNDNHSPDVTGANAGDAWHMLRGGFRTDTSFSAHDSLMFQGDIFTGREGETVDSLPSVTSPGLLLSQAAAGESGGSLQSVWKHTYSARADTTLSASYSAYESDDVLNVFAEGRKTFNLDFQDHVSWGTRQSFVWGLGYQYSTSHSQGNLTVSLNPASLATQLFSSFAQDEIALVPDRLYLTVGAKLEHNYYTGFTLMPSARAAYMMSRNQTVWAAVSKASRTPASIDTAIRENFGSTPGPGGVPVLASLVGNPAIQNEDLIAYEAGYRASVSKNLSIDFAAYYNDYYHQETVEPEAEFLEAAPLPVHFVMPSTFENLMHGEAHGLEIASNWRVTSHWTLAPAYDFERFHMHVSPASQDPGMTSDVEGTDPHQHASLRSHVDLSSTLGWETSAYFVDRIAFQQLPSDTRLDSQLIWRLRERLTLSLVGQNLLRDRHLEFVEPGNDPTMIKRSGYVKVAWYF